MSTGLRAGTNNDGYLQVNGTDVLTALSSGNIGIGLTTITSRLTVANNIESRDTAGWRGIKIENTGSPASVIKSINYLGVGYTADIQFQTMTGTTTTDAVTILGSGNVGIGTTNPSTKLHLYSTISGQIVETLRLQNGSDGLNAGTEIVFASNNVAHGKIQQLVTGSTAGNRGSALAFFTKSDNGSIAERVRISQSGDVGIGTTNPLSKLHVAAGNLKVDSGYGIDFSATSDIAGMTSELLDDYEEGTFTATINSAGITNLSSTSAKYTKIGSLVYFSIYWLSPANANLADLNITGLPFAATIASTALGHWQDGAGYNFYVGRISGNNKIERVAFNATPTYNGGGVQYISGVYTVQ